MTHNKCSLTVIFAGLLFLTFGSVAQAPGPQAVGTLSELMLKIIQPAADAVFYISRTPPQNDSAWLEFENKTLMLAESTNLLMLPGYARDEENWMNEAQLMRLASVSAYRAAQAKNLDALIELNNDLYTSCESCHEAYR